MLDLLGSPVAVDKSYGFEAWWKSYPASKLYPRKGAKKKCLEKWVKLECAREAKHIMKVLHYLMTTDEWRREDWRFVPAPLVWLNQQRWDGAEVPEIVFVDTMAETRAKWAEEDAKKAAPTPEIRARLAELRKSYLSKQ